MPDDTTRAETAGVPKHGIHNNSSYGSTLWVYFESYLFDFPRKTAVSVRT